MLYPLPAVMVSCQKPEEKPNIITVAWTGTICSAPAMVSISVRPERYSYHIIKETGEFVINLTTEKLAYATDYCGVRSGKDVDKFKEMHLTPGRCEGVNAPLIDELPMALECKVKSFEDGILVGDIVNVNADESILTDGRIDPKKLKPISYDPVNNTYLAMGDKVGNAFKDGLKLK